MSFYIDLKNEINAIEQGNAQYSHHSEVFAEAFIGYFMHIYGAPPDAQVESCFSYTPIDRAKFLTSFNDSDTASRLKLPLQLIKGIEEVIIELVFKPTSQNECKVAVYDGTATLKSEFMLVISESLLTQDSLQAGKDAIKAAIISQMPPSLYDRNK